MDNIKSLLESDAGEFLKIAGFTDISVIINDLTSQKILRISLIENIQREELSAIEEAERFARLIKKFNYTHEQLAEILSLR